MTFQEIISRLNPISSSILATLIISIIILYKYFSFKTLENPRPQKKPPPSPPAIPLIGNLHQLGTQPHRALHALSRRHGPEVMLLRLGTVPVVVVSSAEAASEAMRTHDLALSDRPKATAFEKLLYGCRDVSAAPYGEYWRQTKSVFVVHLLSRNRVRSFRRVREEETDLMTEKIRRSCFSAVNLSELFVGLTNDVVCRATFGRKYDGDGELGKRFKGLLGEFTELIGGFYVGDYIPKLAWVSRVSGLDARMDGVAKEFDEFLEGIVEQHLERFCDDHESDQGKNFVDILISIQRENLLGFPIDRTCIKALILDVFAAGTDTTYTVLEWAMSELLKNPNAMKRLQNEVRTVVAHKADMNEDDLEKMPYLKAVFKETLRLHPPIPLLLPRVAKRDFNIKGYDVASGCQMFINAWAVGRDPAAWHGEPGEFRPERFLGSGVDYKGNDFGLIPFGSGRRGCPGILFAMAVNEIALANVVHKFDWSLASDSELDMTETSGLTTRRKFPLMALPKLAS